MYVSEGLKDPDPDPTHSDGRITLAELIDNLGDIKKLLNAPSLTGGGQIPLTVDVNPSFPSDLKPYMQEQAEILLKEKKVKAIPDWSKALRADFMDKARGGA